MKLFITGPFRNREESRTELAQSIKELEADGHECISVFTLMSEDDVNNLPPEKILAITVPKIFDCEAVFALESWWKDKTSEFIVTAARNCDRDVVYAPMFKQWYNKRMSNKN